MHTPSASDGRSPATTPEARPSPPDRGRFRVLQPADLDDAAAMLSRGFAEEPGNVTMFPDPTTRLRIAEPVFRKQLRASLPYGTVYGIDLGGRLVAVAIWHPPHVKPRSSPATIRMAGDLLGEARVLAQGLPHLLSVVARHGRDVTRLLRARGEAVRAASAGPSWHLAFLATDPEHRGRGSARRLLEHVLTRADADGLTAWLETTDPVNPPIYERFGFRNVAHIDEAAWLPGLWVMRREPQRASGRGSGATGRGREPAPTGE
jgi:GNAT superfamily N-acetyltransferase